MFFFFSIIDTETLNKEDLERKYTLHIKESLFIYNLNCNVNIENNTLETRNCSITKNQYRRFKIELEDISKEKDTYPIFLMLKSTMEKLVREKKICMILKFQVYLISIILKMKICFMI